MLVEALADGVVVVELAVCGFPSLLATQVILGAALARIPDALEAA
ncbi:MAG: hypothetical protein AAFY29_01620 [Pseudomonadota bacterium]